MILLKVVQAWIACVFLSYSAVAQEPAPEAQQMENSPSTIISHDFSKTVIPISQWHLQGAGVGINFGTGFCLDPICRYVATNYHVARMGKIHKIKGQSVIHLYLATGPDDDGASMNFGPSIKPMKYNIGRDLAIFELRQPLANHLGADYDLDDLKPDQAVDIYAYPKESGSIFRTLERFQGTFRGILPTGLLAFDYQNSPNKSIRPGASGGVVVDRDTQRIVGILNAIATSGDPIVLAVPVDALVDFVRREEPVLARNLFPMAKAISPVSGDLYPEFTQSPVGKLGLAQRPEETLEVKLLRTRAQLLADSLLNFVAVQTFEWGSGNSAPYEKSAYEVWTVGENQRFRKYPEGGKVLDEAPMPLRGAAMRSGGEWSELPRMVGVGLNLKIRQMEDVVYNGRRMRVFQYRADTEDGLCGFVSIFDFLAFKVNRVNYTGCNGEVWTDERTNILRISLHHEQSGKWWHDYRSTVTYGWVARPDEGPVLVPLTIYAQAGYKKKTYWCHGEFREYRKFKSEVRVASNPTPND